MLLIAGTVPVPEMPLVLAPAHREGDCLRLAEYGLPCTQGTMAMVSAALATTSHLGLPPPQVLTAGDIGTGSGTRLIYDYLVEHLEELRPEVLALHYCQPIIALMKKLYEAIGQFSSPPRLVADAGSMYAAKAAGLAPHFDIFTPDPSEIAFLADPEASHPAYISRYLFEDMEEKVPELIEKAYACRGASRVLLVKGKADYVAKEGKILYETREPNIPAMECIGGTGDTITGMVAAFLSGGLDPEEAAVLAAKANRAAAEMVKPTPATRVSAIIDAFPQVFKENLCAWSGVCIR